MHPIKRLTPRLFLGLWVLTVGLGLMPQPLQAGTAVVIDDGNNLRAWGGENYQQAPIVHVLNRGDYVWVQEKRGKWARVSTSESLNGWVNVQCLREAPDTGKPQNLSPALKARLEQFLQQLRTAVQNRSFQQLAPLIAPGGLVIEGRMFKDAGLDPGRQTPAILALWYASDVSLTMGTAWQLLIEGTRPPPVKASWDKASKYYKVGVTQGQPSVTLEDQAPLLPTHLGALKLAPVVRYVTGWPTRPEGFPEPEPGEFRFDPQKTPFSWVFQVGPDRYQLMQLVRIGFYLEVTDRPGEGMRLWSLATQNP